MGKKISPNDPPPIEDAPLKKSKRRSSAEEQDPKEVDLYEKYEKEIVKKRHNCSDIICLILFIIFCLAQLVLSILIYIQPGDPRNLLYPHDSDGNLCSGSTSNLFYFNIVECASASSLVTGCTTPTRCVSSCPTSIYYYYIQSHRDYMLSNLCIYSSLYSYYNGNIPTTVSLSAYQTLMANRICPSYAIPSSPLYYRCIPSLTSSSSATVNVTDSTTGTSYTVTDQNGGAITYSALQSGVDYLMKLLNLKGIAQFMFEDFYNSWFLMVLLFVVAAIISFLYIIIMRWVLAPLIYITMVAFVAVFVFGIYFCFNKFAGLGGFSNKVAFTSNVSDFFSNAWSWFACGSILCIILLVMLLVLLVLVKRLRFAIQIICEASKAVQGVFITLVFPVVPLLLQLGFLVYFVANAVLLASAGNAIFKVANSTSSSMPTGSSCNAGSSSSSVTCVFYSYGFDSSSTFNSMMAFLSTYQYVPQLFNIFMFFWIQAFIVAFNQMVLAGSFGIWYWSKNKSRMIFLTSLKDTIVYHMGTLAFGSLLIAICKFVRFIITQIEKRLKKAVGNKSKIVSCIITFVSCCCKCCLWCLEKFLKYVNRKAYIMCAIYGSNFCVSAISAFKLLLANPAKTLILDGVSFFLLLLGKLLITGAVGVLAFYLFTNSFSIPTTLPTAISTILTPTLHYYWLPLVTVIIGTFLIAKLFLTVFEMAVDTVFLCALKDLDIHDGSPEKPYYMSKKLMEIMNKKNKPEKNKKGNKIHPESDTKVEDVDAKH